MTTAELAAAGISRGELRRLVREDVLVPLARSVYAPAERVARHRQDPAGAHALRAAAALARLGPGHAASHQTAALIHGLDLLGHPPEGVQVTRPPGGTGSRSTRTGLQLHAAALPAGHLMVRDGVAVTSVARTVIDLARTLPVQAGLVAADSALHRRHTSKADLNSVITTCAGWPGSHRAREVVAFSDARAESALESISRLAFRDQGLPPPELQVWVGRDEAVARVDFLWPDHRTIAEADGAIKYADPTRARAQLSRDARLRNAGFEVVHFTWEQIARVPWQVAADIRRAFARQAR